MARATILAEAAGRPYSLYDAKDVNSLITQHELHIKGLLALTDVYNDFGDIPVPMENDLLRSRHDLKWLVEYKAYTQERAGKNFSTAAAKLIDWPVRLSLRLGNKFEHGHSYIIMNPQHTSGVPESVWFQVGGEYGTNTLEGVKSAMTMLQEVIDELHKSPIHYQKDVHSLFLPKEVKSPFLFRIIDMRDVLKGMVAELEGAEEEGMAAELEEAEEKNAVKAGSQKEGETTPTSPKNTSGEDVETRDLAATTSPQSDEGNRNPLLDDLLMSIWRSEGLAEAPPGMPSWFYSAYTPTTNRR